LHGLKKGGLRRGADAGMTTHELMAISGHKTRAPSIAEVIKPEEVVSKDQSAEIEFLNRNTNPSHAQPDIMSGTDRPLGVTRLKFLSRGGVAMHSE
jgi:hypothetical protein